MERLESRRNLRLFSFLIYERRSIMVKKEDDLYLNLVNDEIISAPCYRYSASFFNASGEQNLEEKPSTRGSFMVSILIKTQDGREFTNMVPIPFGSTIEEMQERVTEEIRKIAQDLSNE